MTVKQEWSAGHYLQSAGRILRMTDFDNLAKLIKEAAKVREESCTVKDSNFGSFATYGLSINQSCEQVGKDLNLGFQHISLASLMLFSYWNDALDWADRQIYPAEMAYVEACYRCANALKFGDFGDDLESSSDLAKQFCKSAEDVRKSLYGFGQD